MKVQDLKYLLAYVVPLTGYFAVFGDGVWRWSAVLFAFGCIPILEFFVPTSKDNLTEEEKEQKKLSKFFDVLLYLNIPIVFALIVLYLIEIQYLEWFTVEWWGLTFSVGIVLGAAINVAHELGHKQHWYQKWSALTLLLPSLYMHFIIEHNRGHHLNVGTPDDPATSKKGELLFTFWFRSVISGYLHAWKLENQRLSKVGKKVVSLSNEMIQYTLIEVTYLVIITLIFGTIGLVGALSIAVFGFLLLETINYIEHYGLQRKKLSNGRYERVEVFHSWNSNHEIGRIMLYELTRHSDHHFKANKKYQVLNHYDESPQLPFGYPTSMLLAMIPPLWFSIMNRRIPNQNIPVKSAA